MAGFTVQLSKSCFVIRAEAKPGCVHHICELCPSQVALFLEPSLLPRIPSLGHPRLTAPLVSMFPLVHQACSGSGAVSQSSGSAGNPSFVSSIPDVAVSEGDLLLPGKGPPSRTVEKCVRMCSHSSD